MAAKLALAGGTMTGKITLDGDPASSLHAVTKQYVDGLVLGLGQRQRVRAATTANITISTALNNGDSLDGVTLATDDYVLVKNQSAPEENGIYIVGASPARAAEFEVWGDHPGSIIGVAEGTTNDDTIWICTSNYGGTLGSTAIAFTKLITQGELLAANNLSDVANTATSRTNLGLGTGDSPEFTAVNVGNASDTTVSRSSAGRIAVEGNELALTTETQQVTQNAQTGTTYTLAASDKGKMVTLSNASAITLTVNNSVHAAGDRIDLAQIGAGQVTISAGAGMTIRQRQSYTKIAGQYGGATLWFISASECYLFGDLSA